LLGILASLLLTSSGILTALRGTVAARLLALTAIVWIRLALLPL
jgi:hypothetical protein